MNTNTIQRLVEGIHWGEFQDLAFLILEKRGYERIEITDGRYDGGADLIPFRMPPQEAVTLIQLSTSKEWRAKLRRDAKKASDNYNCKHVVYVTSRRIPETEFSTERDNILRDTGVIVTRIDAQGIASTVLSHSIVDEFLDVVGVSIDTADSGVNSVTDFKAIAAASFSLFGEEPSEFRKSIIRSAVLIGCADQKAGIHRDELTDKIVTMTGLSAGKRKIVSGTIDRLLQSRDIKTNNDGLIVADEDQVRQIQVEKSIYKEEEKDLREALKGFLEEVGEVDLVERQVDQVMECIGAVLLEIAGGTASSLGLSDDKFSIERLRQRMNQLHVVFDEIGVPQDNQRKAIMADLAELASESAASQRLFSGELFFLLTDLKTSQLVNAFRARTGLEVLLDASVAMPILCSQLHAPSNDAHSRVAAAMSNSAQQHGITLSIPDHYMEEAAVHLIKAAEDYAPLFENSFDPDLSDSNNAYVSHFANITAGAYETSFNDYLDSLGYMESFKDMPFDGKKRSVKFEIGRKFAEYNISRRTFERITKSNTELVYRQLSETLEVEGGTKSRITLEHDVEMIAFLDGNATNTEYTYVLCTLDSIFNKYKKRYGGSWEAIPPSALSHILNLASPNSERLSLRSPLLLAPGIQSEVQTLGAKVWDTIVNIESGNLSDAKLVTQAKGFKQKFIDSHTKETSVREIEEAWDEWKSKNEG
jgi:hypothetical protein